MVIAAVGGPAIANWARTSDPRRHADPGGATSRPPATGHHEEREPRVRSWSRTKSYWTTTRTTRPSPRPERGQTLTTAAPDAAQSVGVCLPQGVQFATNAAECTAAAGFAQGDYGFRFNRLGACVDPGRGGSARRSSPTRLRPTSSCECCRRSSCACTSRLRPEPNGHRHARRAPHDPSSEGRENDDRPTPASPLPRRLETASR